MRLIVLGRTRLACTRRIPGLKSETWDTLRGSSLNRCGDRSGTAEFSRGVQPDTVTTALLTEEAKGFSPARASTTENAIRV